MHLHWQVEKPALSRSANSKRRGKNDCGKMAERWRRRGEENPTGDLRQEKIKEGRVKERFDERYQQTQGP